MAKKEPETKYTLLPKKRVEILGETLRLHQIKALRDIPLHSVKAGDLGGYIGKRANLSQEGDCWIKEGSVVFSDSYALSNVSGDALVDGNYLIRGSIIKDNAIISGGKGKVLFSRMYNNSKIEGNVYLKNSYLSRFSSIKYMPPSENQPEVTNDLEYNIHVIYGVFNDLRISGHGEIVNVASDESFEVTGYFNLSSFVDEQSKRLTLKKPFKANGNVTMRKIDIGNALIDISGKVTMDNIYIGDGSVTIHGGTLTHSQLKGIADIAGNVNIENSSLDGENYLRDTVNISGAQLKGKNILTGDTKVLPGTIIENQELSGGDADPANNLKSIPTITEIEPLEFPVQPANIVVPTVNNSQHVYREIIKTVEADYEAYTTDIVKLIKYPAMADASIPETRALMMTLRSAQRVIKANDTDSLGQTARDLEEAFIQAENKAYKLAATFLSDKERSGLKRANQALAIALDENATEHERRAGYKSGMKSLEGVLPVSDEAVYALKERIGLKEIEA